MQMAKVIGTVVASRKEEVLEGLRFLILEPVDANTMKGCAAPVVAADAVGAGVGELVLFCSGLAARQTRVTKGLPVDAVCMAIIDQVHVE